MIYSHIDILSNITEYKEFNGVIYDVWIIYIDKPGHKKYAFNMLTRDWNYVDVIKSFHKNTTTSFNEYILEQSY